jgi:SAM-dependent methyltransferase
VSRISAAFDPKTASPSVFPAHDAAAYEQIMGRRSRLAPLLIEFGGLAETALSMSDAEPATSALRCPKQLMSLPLPASTMPRRSSRQAAHKRSNKPRFGFQHADARALPFDDGSFDFAFSMLVLQFIPDVEHAVAEMRRVLRPAGRVTAAVWDGFGGTPVFRLFLDTTAVLSPTIERPRALFSSLTASGEMSAMWRQAGLVEA